MVRDLFHYHQESAKTCKFYKRLIDDMYIWYGII